MTVKRCDGHMMKKKNNVNAVGKNEVKVVAVN